MPGAPPVLLQGTAPQPHMNVTCADTADFFATRAVTTHRHRHMAPASGCLEGLTYTGTAHVLCCAVLCCAVLCCGAVRTLARVQVHASQRGHAGVVPGGAIQRRCVLWRPRTHCQCVPAGEGLQPHHALHRRRCRPQHPSRRLAHTCNGSALRCSSSNIRRDLIPITRPCSTDICVFGGYLGLYPCCVTPSDAFARLLPLVKRLIPENPNTLLTGLLDACLLYTSPSPRDRQKSRMPSSA